MPRATHTFFGRGKNGGIRQDLNAYEVPPGQFVDLNAMRVRKGCPDGTDMGTGEYLNASSMAFELYAMTPWNSANGKNYIFAYTSSGKLAYTSDDWATWDFLETAVGSDLTLGATHVIPFFLVRGNKSMLISNGIDSVYLVDGVAFPSSGALKATELTTCPAFVEGWFLHGVTIVHDGEVVYASSPMDMDRFYSTAQERTDRVYDDNCWVAPAAPGVSGHITKGVYMGEDSIMLFTTTGVYWLGLEPDAEGIMRLNIISLLDGAGAHSGAACADGRGNGYFFTDYNRGDILRLSRGGQRGGGKVDIEARNGWAVKSVGYGLRNTLQSIPASNRKYLQLVVDEKGDWERVAASLRTNLDTTTLPGKIFINPNAHISVLGTGIDLTPILDINTWYSPSGEPMISMTISSGKVEGNLYDSNPDYSAGETNYHGGGTYTEVVLRNNSAWFNALKNIHGMVHQSFGIELLKDGAWITPKFAGQDATFDPNKSGANSWQHIPFDEIHNNCSGIRLRIMLMVRWSYTPPGQSTLWAAQSFYLNIPVYFSNQAISGVRLFDTKVTTSGTWDDDWTFQCGEIWPEGATTTQATYYSDPAPDGASVKSNLVIKGFTPSSAAEFGRITARFTKVDNVYYPKVYVRIGKTQYPPKDDNKTTDPTSSGGAGVATANWSAWRLLTLTELEQGLKLTDSGFNYSGGAATASAAQADGTGWLWVRFKITLDLDTKSRLSPVMDRLRFYGIAGTLKLANHFMFSGPDDHIFLCAPSNAGSAENDIAVFYDPMADAMLKTEGQRITAACKKGGSYYAATGRRVAKLWEGDHNYVYDSAAGTTSDVALQRRLETGAIRGRSLKALRHRFYVEKLETGGAIEATLSNTKFNADISLIVSSQYFAQPFAMLRQKQLVKGKDGFYYYLWIGASGAPSLYLSKLSPTTGEKLQTWTIETRTVNYGHYGISMCEDLAGDNLLIAYVGYQAADSTSPQRRLTFAKFNIDAQALIGPTDIYGAASAVYYYYPCVEVDSNGDYYIAYNYNASATNTLKLIRSLDGGTTWAAAASFAPPTNEKHNIYLSRTHEEKLCLIYKKYNAPAGSVLYFREIPNGIAGDEIIISYPSGTCVGSSCLVRTSAGTYLLMCVANSLYLYVFKYENGVFTQVKSQAAIESATPCGLELADGNLLVAYVARGGSNFACIIGQDESWSAETVLLTSGGSISQSALDIVRVSNGLTDKSTPDVYLVGGYTDTTLGYRLFKTTIGEATGAYPLQTYVKTENGSILTYSDRETFSAPRIIPEDENPGNTGSVHQLSQVLEAYGPVIVAFGELDYLEQA